MKRYFLFTLFLIAITVIVNAQQVLLPRTMLPGVYQPGTTLQQVVNQLNANIMPSDTGEGGFNDRMSEFTNFWQKRVIANDSTANAASHINMFSQYYHSLSQSLIDHSLMDCTTSDFQGNWQCLGPDNLPYPLNTTISYQALGKVDAIWADPEDSNYILAGTVGGLFKTTNGGGNWKCITDNAPIVTGVIGISSIAVSPLNRDTIYLGTTGYDYGAGILKSFDGGQTWQQEFVTNGTPTYGDSLQYIQRIYFTPDGSRLYAFKFDSVFTRSNFGTDNIWVNITPINRPEIDSADFTWYELHFLPGNQNHIFICNQNGRGNHLPFCGIWEADVPVPTIADWTKITDSLSGTLTGYSSDIPNHYNVIQDSFVIMSFSIPDSDTLFAIGMSIYNNKYVGLWKYNLTGTVHTWTFINPQIFTTWAYSNSSWTHFILNVSMQLLTVIMD